jgi:hypothetical protein
MNTIRLFETHIGQLMTQYGDDRVPSLRGKIQSVTQDGQTLIVRFEWMEEYTPSFGDWGSVEQREIRFLVAPVAEGGGKFRIYQDHADVFLGFEPLPRTEGYARCAA